MQNCLQTENQSVYQLKKSDKLYVIVRKDLKPGIQLAQACHACFYFSQQYPLLTATWMRDSDYICILSVSNEIHLQELLKQATQLEIAVSSFHESDLDNSLTAIALEPNIKSKELCKNLKLALKDK